MEAGGLGAVVSRAPAGGGPRGEAAVRAHGRTVEGLLALRAVVPFPPGLRARDEAAVRRFLERERMALEEALATLADTYEVRVHARAGREAPDRPAGRSEAAAPEAASPGPGESDAGEGELSGSPEERLRLERLLERLCRLAVSCRPLPRGPGGGKASPGSSHAFLVERSEWISFVEEATGSAGETGVLELDATGPWPPYDFVRIVPAAEGERT